MTEPLKPKSNRGWRISRRILIVLALLATLIAAFYTEEDWRGKRAWENCKRELEAQGVVVEWSKFIPAPVPDDQNFYTASTNILQKFKQLSGTNDPDYKVVQENPWLRKMTTGPFSFPIFDSSTSGPLVVATIIISPSTSSNRLTGINTSVLALDDPAAPGRAQDLIHATIGQSIEGVQGFKFSEHQLTNIQPAQIFLRAQSPPSIGDLERLIPSDTVANIGKLGIAPTDNQNIFNVSLTSVPITAAADYLKWSDQFVPAFDEIREALKRPYAMLPGDYSNPPFMPIPNFVFLRALAQTLAQRAQCYLLLCEPDKALHELTLIHDVCRILEKPPSGPPETLIEAMINVAFTGIYAEVIAEGIRQHQWQESQLIALQQQLKETDLSPYVFESLQQGPARISRIAETATPPTWISSRVFDWSVPRGWLYQMMVVAAKLESHSLVGVDLENNTISPKKLNDTMQDIDTSLNRHSPFTLLARIVLPNELKAWQTTAYIQTLVNQTQIACALERYRLAHGQYPETLDALTPQFMEIIPHDIIGGEPLHYRRTPDGKFLLYSVGWNETDDGGQEPAHMSDYTKGDWVWKPWKN